MPTLILLAVLAEVDCATGYYTGYRMRHWEDPIVLHHRLYHGRWYWTTAVKPYCLYA